jgi:HEAT repeat protein
MRETKTSSHRLLARKPLLIGAFALFAALASLSFPWLATRAQRASREPVVNVTGISVRSSAGGEIVSITADAPLSRAQTWQDEEGFHVVGYKWTGAFAGVPRGVKVRRVGDSLELVFPTHNGANVTVVPHGNALDVIVSGGLSNVAEQQRASEPTPRQRKQAQTQPQEQTEPRQREGDAQPKAASHSNADRGASRASSFIASKEKSVAAIRALTQPVESKQKDADGRAQSAQSQSKNAQQPAPTMLFKSVQTTNQQSSTTQNAPIQNAQVQNAPGQNPAIQNSKVQNSQVQNAQVQNAPIQNVPPQSVATTATSVGATQGAPQQATPAQSQQPSQSPAQVSATPALLNAASLTGGGLSLFPLVVVGAFLCVGLVVFLFLYLRRQRAAVASDERGELVAEKSEKGNKAKNAGADVMRKEELNVKATTRTDTGVALMKQGSKLAPPMFVLPTQFGAFRIDQEVDKLVRGEAHSIDVLASRASEDRRAVEASLLKSLASPELIESERERARTALDEYGFVARQSAAVLLAPDAYGRSAAARSLGQIKSAASLPFLLEALYDSDTVVRAEAVASLGSLGLPRAIGALLDVARRHPEIPSALVTDALDACSLDALDFESLGLMGNQFTGEINALEPIAEVDQLPEWLEDETLAEALTRLESTDVEARVAAAQQLSQFQVRRAVDALASMAANDRDAQVRAAAVTSLGMINHESVFAAILIAMADESREVRAASARALSRLNFDRADAYVRVLETSDDATLHRTAEACVTAGLARQAMDRLASDDRRQAYEAFSLLSLVARGGQTDVILHVVKGHPDLNVRLAASRLLALQGDEDVDRRLRQIALEGNTPEKLREAIMEVCERRSQPRDAAVADPTNESDKSLHGIA